MKQAKRPKGKLAISKKALVSLVAESLKGKVLFKEKVDNVKELLKNEKKFVPSK